MTENVTDAPSRVCSDTEGSSRNQHRKRKNRRRKTSCCASILPLFFAVIFAPISIALILHFYQPDLLLFFQEGPGNPRLAIEYVELFNSFESSTDLPKSFNLVLALKESGDHLTKSARNTIAAFDNYDEHFRQLIVEIMNLQQEYSDVTNRAWAIVTHGYSWTNDMQVVVDDIFESLKDQELTRANEIVDSTLAEWRQILKLHQHLQEKLELLEWDLMGLVKSSLDGELMYQQQSTDIDEEQSTVSGQVFNLGGYFASVALGGLPGLGAYAGVQLLRDSIAKELPAEKKKRLDGMITAFSSFASELNKVKEQVHGDVVMTSELVESVENIGRSLRHLDLTFTEKSLRSDDLKAVLEAKDRAKGSLHTLSSEYAALFREQLMIHAPGQSESSIETESPEESV